MVVPCNAANSFKIDPGVVGGWAFGWVSGVRKSGTAPCAPAAWSLRTWTAGELKPGKAKIYRGRRADPGTHTWSLWDKCTKSLREAWKKALSCFVFLGSTPRPIVYLLEPLFSPIPLFCFRLTSPTFSPRFGCSPESLGLNKRRDRYFLCYGKKAPRKHICINTM